MQQDLILADLASSQRSYIRPPYTPSPEITESADPVEPIEGETTPSYGSIYFEWSDVPNATGYLLEVARNNSFTLQASRYITSNNSINIADVFDANRTYYWRVRPFNDLHTCIPFSETQQFQSGTEATAVNEIKAVSDWTIDPNPVATDALVNVRVNATASFNAQVNLYHINGQLVKQLGDRPLLTGENVFTISTNGLSNGVYLVSLLTEEGQIHKRLVISK